jgi:hypothetical protein
LFDQPDLMTAVLASLRDHPRGKEEILSLFGIRARLPAGVQLLRFRFETGRYHLHWRNRRHQIGLYRWAPAGILLARQPLTGFAAQQFQTVATELTPWRQGESEGVDGGWTSGFSMPARFSHFRFRRLLRLWHVGRHNCLLGVEVRGRGKGLSALVERLCNSYVSF